MTAGDDDREPAATEAERVWTGVELATIWATVDLERALRERGHDLRSLTTTADPLLGARVALIPAGDGRAPVAMAEPTTEGRLAATLARNGEGPAGRYLAVAGGLGPARARAATAGIAVSRVERGPFGPSMLVLGGVVSGPHLILCEGTAVPSNP